VDDFLKDETKLASETLLKW